MIDLLATISGLFFRAPKKYGWRGWWYFTPRSCTILICGDYFFLRLEWWYVEGASPLHHPLWVSRGSFRTNHFRERNFSLSGAWSSLLTPTRYRVLPVDTWQTIHLSPAINVYIAIKMNDFREPKIPRLHWPRLPALTKSGKLQHSNRKSPCNSR